MNLKCNKKVGWSMNLHILGIGNSFLITATTICGASMYPPHSLPVWQETTDLRHILGGVGKEKLLPPPFSFCLLNEFHLISMLPCWQTHCMGSQGCINLLDPITCSLTILYPLDPYVYPVKSMIWISKYSYPFSILLL